MKKPPTAIEKQPAPKVYHHMVTAAAQEIEDDGLHNLLAQPSPPSTSSAVGISLLNSEQTVPHQLAHMMNENEEGLSPKSPQGAKFDKLLPQMLSKRL